MLTSFSGFFCFLCRLLPSLLSAAVQRYKGYEMRNTALSGMLATDISIALNMYSEAWDFTLLVQF